MVVVVEECDADGVLIEGENAQLQVSACVVRSHFCHAPLHLPLQPPSPAARRGLSSREARPLLQEEKQQEPAAGKDRVWEPALGTTHILAG